MKAYRIEILVIDCDEVGGDGIKRMIENARYPNRAISPEVLRVSSADIGEWEDNHPLNRADTSEEYLAGVEWDVVR